MSKYSSDKMFSFQYEIVCDFKLWVHAGPTQL